MSSVLPSFPSGTLEDVPEACSLCLQVYFKMISCPHISAYVAKNGSIVKGLRMNLVGIILLIVYWLLMVEW